MTFDFDLFVIGGGSGGVRAARVAARETGAKVALAEMDRYGGTCVIRGCVPKKLMVFASEYAPVVEDAAGYGWKLKNDGFDWGAFKDRLETELDRLEDIYRNLLSGSGVTTFDTRARVSGPHEIELATGETLSAKHILVATGGRPFVPDFPGKEHTITSNEMFHLPEIPKRLLIVGGGYIACEFAGIMNGLGSEVCQYYRGAQILRGFDDEARGLIAEGMRDRGVDIHTGTSLMEVRETPDGIWTKATDGSEIVVDAIMMATGRTPNTQDIGLEHLGVEIGRRGEIVVDEYSQTSIPSIYAIGDVTNRVNLTPVAIREGMQFVETVFRGNPTPVDHALIPSAVFTQPEMGTVGMTEEDARDQEEIDVYATSFKPMQTAFIGRTDRVLMKLIVSKATRKILGCHIVSPGAGEMIQLAGVAIKMGATKEDFDRTVAVHPTVSEELVTLRTPVRSA
ncbi:MAG: glutathione-disulfide reductase [Pseudomonadota bacterium]